MEDTDESCVVDLKPTKHDPFFFLSSRTIADSHVL